MTHLTLVRHGQTDWNLQGLCQGQLDIPLNAAGLAEVEQAGLRLKDERFDAFYSSDLSRAIQTAEAVNRYQHMTIVPDARLRELYFGEWEGQPFATLKAQRPSMLDYWLFDPLVPPGGETTEEFARRSRVFLDEILERHRGQRVVITAHGGSLKMLVLLTLRMPIETRWQLRMGNAAISRLQYYKEGGVLLSYNDTAHMDALRRTSEALKID
ncbi:MAG: histidine phosphatase family protein [Anaerolineae bacterium]|nr:histidine phosphatase family protein [Anaerolineae bacterium]